ncbi:hypothetical protein Q5P01_022803 [Channa striata]|uniref:Uncharacterized protein n=1 Tax=Channa striata TaxID=64152 RepID=A0AA88LRL8_CHASR|nr:hypothetical protein Q5P01_022803 [Channa striata]
MHKGPRRSSPPALRATGKGEGVGGQRDNGRLPGPAGPRPGARRSMNGRAHVPSRQSRVSGLQPEQDARPPSGRIAARDPRSSNASEGDASCSALKSVPGATWPPRGRQWARRGSFEFPAVPRKKRRRSRPVDYCSRSAETRGSPEPSLRSPRRARTRSRAPHTHIGTFSREKALLTYSGLSMQISVMVRVLEIFRSFCLQDNKARNLKGSWLQMTAAD